MEPGKRFRFRSHFRVLFVVSGVVALFCAIYVWEPWKPLRFRRPATQAYEAISKDLYKELQTTQNDGWNGTYFANRKDGVLMSLTIARNSGWIFECYDSNGNYDRNFGRLYFSSDRNVIHLEPTFSSEHLPTNVYPLKRDKISFLISSNEVDKFNASTASGTDLLSSGKSEFLAREE